MEYPVQDPLEVENLSIEDLYNLNLNQIPSLTQGAGNLYHNFHRIPAGYWEKVSVDEPMLSPTETWEGDDVESPTVVMGFDGEFKMLYEGHGGANYSIGLATSEDLLNWSKYDGNPVLSSPDGNLWIPNLLVGDDGKYHLWFRDGRISPEGVSYATSDDLIDWTVTQGVFQAAANITDFSVIRYGKEFIMFYETDYAPMRMRRSKDETSWDGEDVVVARPVASGATKTIMPSPLVVGGNIYLQWHEDEGGDWAGENTFAGYLPFSGYLDSFFSRQHSGFYGLTWGGKPADQHQHHLRERGQPGRAVSLGTRPQAVREAPHHLHQTGNRAHERYGGRDDLRQIARLGRP